MHVVEHIYSMKIVYKLMTEPNVIVERIIDNVDYINVGKKSISYRLRDRAWIYSIRYDSVSHIRVLEDGKNENEN